MFAVLTYIYFVYIENDEEVKKIAQIIIIVTVVYPACYDWT